MKDSILANPAVVKLLTNVVEPIVKFLFAAAVFYFIFGVFVYIRNADDSSERLSGGRHILYGTVGLFIMISVWGIIAVIRSTLGVH